MLEKLKSLNLDRMLDVDECVSLSAYARALEAEYEELGLEAPEWLTKAIDTLRAEITRRCREADFNRMKELERVIDVHTPGNEKLRNAKDQLAELQRKHGLIPTGGRSGKNGK